MNTQNDHQFYKNGFTEGKSSVRKWEKFSDEELVRIGVFVMGATSYTMRKIQAEITEEENFRLALKDAESESVENLESAAQIHYNKLSEE